MEPNDKRLLKYLKEEGKKQDIELLKQFSIITAAVFIFAAITSLAVRDIYPYKGDLYGAEAFYQLTSYVLLVMVAIPTILAAFYGFKVVTARFSTEEDID